MKSIRFLCLILASVTVFSLAVSCSKKKSADSDSSITKSGEEDIGSDLPKKNYNGADFTIMCRDPEMAWGELAIITEEQGTTVLDDATYNRNLRVEEDYGITFRYTTFNDANYSNDMFANAIRENAQAYDDIADICIPGAIDAATIAPTGAFLNLDTDVPYVDLDHTWWQKMLNDSMGILNKHYFAINDALLNDKLDTYAMFFSKTQFDDKGIDYPYAIVDAGTWDIPTFMEMIKGQGNDLNGNMVEDYEDQYGYIGFLYDVFFVGSGIRGAYLDQTTGEPTLTPFSDKIEAIYENVLEIAMGGALYDTYNVGQEPYINGDINETFLQAFDNKALFLCGPMIFYTSIIPKMQTEVGIVPCPKYDEKQETYYHRAGYNGATVITVLDSVRDRERAGIILEAFGAASQKYIRPAFYDKLLTDRYAQDEESKRMISLIIDTEVFDLDQIFRWCAVLEGLQGAVGSQSKSAATYYGRVYNMGLSKIQETVDAYKGLDSGK